MKNLSNEYQKLKNLEARNTKRVRKEEKGEEELYEVLERAWVRKMRAQKKKGKDY